MVGAAMAMAITMPVDAARCGLRERVDRIERRIDRGIDSGRLTPREVRWLEHQRSRIRMLARELREDGYMSARDCHVLEQRVDDLEDSVSRLKRNDRANDDWRDGRY